MLSPGPQPLASAIAAEKTVVEAPAVALLSTLGWHTANLTYETPGPNNPTGRKTLRDVFLPARLRTAVRSLNPSLPQQAIDDALTQLTADRSAMLPAAANREVFHLLREGAPVELRQPDGSVKPDRVRLIDWREPTRNDFFLASQMWIASDLYKRRPDAIGFVNGIPLVLLEFKAPQNAISGSLRRQPQGLPRRHPTSVPSQRLRHPVQCPPGLDGAIARSLGSVRGLEAIGGGGARRSQSGNDASRDL
jgi:type I restriction enzyme R subunit